MAVPPRASSRHPDGSDGMSVTTGYKMTDDSRFAPNPFHRVRTLATCKPAIRRCRHVGEWVAGFASKKLVDSARRLDVTIPRDGLVYLMRLPPRQAPVRRDCACGRWRFLRIQTRGNGNCSTAERRQASH